MNRDLLDKLVRAVLYEGYILYPYRPSVKNRQRWTFGGLYPQMWSEAQDGADPWWAQTQCLVTGNNPLVSASIRFLHLVDRVVGQLPVPMAELAADHEPDFHAVESLEIEGDIFQSWQEAVEREVDWESTELSDLIAAPRAERFAFEGSRSLEPLRRANGLIAAALIRQQRPLKGGVEVSSQKLRDDLWKITVKVLNRTAPGEDQGVDRDKALMSSLVSTHAVLNVADGEFVSMIDPPESRRAAVADCRNVGLWPVLAGEPPQRDTLLCSPIILYDYPQIAPESPGDLFDATEIDEILSLRIMTLTEDEQRQAAAVDPRARDLLRRTQAMAREQLMNLHGTMRGMRPVVSEPDHG